MDWTAIPNSSNVRRVGYDPETSTLGVEFKNGRTYTYEGVPAGLHEDLLAAGSVGLYLHRNVIGVYPHKA